MNKETLPILIDDLFMVSSDDSTQKVNRFIQTFKQWHHAVFLAEVDSPEFATHFRPLGCFTSLNIFWRRLRNEIMKAKKEFSMEKEDKFRLQVFFSGEEMDFICYWQEEKIRFTASYITLDQQGAANPIYVYSF